MFTTDSRTENFLTAMGVKYEYRSGLRLPSDLSDEWNTDNIGRPVAVREDAVFEYAALMEAGSSAPAPILSQPNHEPGQTCALRVLDGVQRLSAAELQQATRFSGYVVLSDSEDALAAIRVLANARLQGRAEPAEWTRRRAVEVLVVGRGMSSAEVARMGGWKASDIQKIADAIELQASVYNVGGPELSDAMLTALRPHLQGTGLLEKAPHPVVGLLHTLRQSRIAVADAVPYVNAFFMAFPKAGNPHRILSDRLKDIHEDPEMRARLTGRPCAALQRDVLLLRSLKTADTFVDAILTHGERVVNVDEMFRILERIERKLKSIAPNKAAQVARVPADMWSDKT